VSVCAFTATDKPIIIKENNNNFFIKKLLNFVQIKKNSEPDIYLI